MLEIAYVLHHVLLLPTSSTNKARASTYTDSFIQAVTGGKRLFIPSLIM